MNKTELIAAMVEASGLTKKDCEVALAAFTGAVETAMKRAEQGADGGLWQLRGQGAPCPRGPKPPYRRVHDLPRLQGAGFQARQGAQRRHRIKQA